MARNWLSIRVELVGSRFDPELWPRPGRVLIATPTMTFRDLARAIDLAFARWDLDHVHRFRLGDGTTLMPPDPPSDRPDTQAAPTGPAGPADGPRRLADSRTKLLRLSPGEQFLYEFDVDAPWQHLCTVGPRMVEPVPQFGLPPDRPVPVLGWGSIPDQYDRRWEHDGRDGTPMPPAPAPTLSDLPPLAAGWGQLGARATPGSDFPYVVDAHISSEGIPHGVWTRTAANVLGRVLANADDDSLISLLGCFDAMMAAQRCAPALLRLALTDVPEIAGWLHGFVDGLRQRAWPGDVELADVLVAHLRGRPDQPDLPRPIPVDIETLAAILDSRTPPGQSWTLDTVTGQLFPPGDPSRRPKRTEAAGDGDGGGVGGGEGGGDGGVFEHATMADPSLYRSAEEVDEDTAAEQADEPPDTAAEQAGEPPDTAAEQAGEPPDTEPQDVERTRIGLVGLGPDVEQEDLRVIAELLDVSFEEDRSAQSRLLLRERQLGRARAWLADVGLRPA